MNIQTKRSPFVRFTCTGTARRWREEGTAQ